MKAGGLAINGGAPVRSQVLPYGRQTVTREDIEAVAKVLSSDYLTTGPAVARFEKSIAEAVSAKHAVAVSSGTAALHAMYAVAGIGPGDEVIVPVITFAATANAALYLGAKPVFADVDPDTLLIDPASVEQAITSRTAAIVAVDFAGQVAQYEDLFDAVRGRPVKVLADAAHALGATRHGKPAGSIAAASAFSFHPVKHVASGEGGAVTTDDDAAAAALKTFRNHGITSDHVKRSGNGTWEYDMAVLGFNYRLSDIHCALGVAQIARLRANVERRQQIARRYDSAFAGLDTVRPLRTLKGNSHAYHIYVLQLELSLLTVGRREVFQALRAENIGVNVHYRPVPWHSYYRGLGYEPGHWPAGEAAYDRIITLPLWPGMSDQDADDVIEAVTKVVSAFRK